MKRFSFLLLVATLAWSQSQTATLRGVVRDATGASVPEATLFLIESATDHARTIIADRAGRYDAPYLTPGPYNLIIDERGYQRYSVDQLLLEPGEVRRLDPALAPLPATPTSTAPEEEKPPVHVGPAPVDTQTGTLRPVIDNRKRFLDAPFVDKLPSPFPLLTTVPGVQGTADGLVISGVSDRNRQTWKIDGLADDANTTQTANPNFFEYVEATTANPGSYTYRATGFDMISKRGGNGFHGSVYYKRGSSEFDARPYFDTQKNRYKQHEEEGELSGTVIPNFTFFYGGWMHQSNPYNQTLYADVPTDQMRAGNFSAFLDPQTSPTGKVVVIRDPRSGNPFPGNQVPGSRFNSVANNILNNYLPAPTTEDPNAFPQNFSWTHPFGPGLWRGDWPFARIDQKLADNHLVYFRFFENITSNVAAGTVGRQLASTQKVRYKSYAVSYTGAFASSVVNQFTFGYARNQVRRGDEVGDVTPLKGDQVVSTMALQGTNLKGHSVMGFPTIDINGLTPLEMTYAGGYTDNTTANDRRLTLQDAVAWTRGRNTIKVGVQFTHFNWLQGAVPQAYYGAFSFSGAFTGLGFADLLLGVPATSARVLDPKIDNRLHQDQDGLFLAGSLRATSRLTVDYGLRWDYFGSPVFNDGFMYNWDPSSGNVIVADGTITAVNSLYPKAIKAVVGQVVPDPKMTNVRPRAAVAYRLKDRLVLRAGYGEFTDGGAFGPNGRVNDTNGPYRISETYYNSIVNGAPQYTMPRPFPGTLSQSLTGAQAIRAIPLATDEGRIRQYNLSLEGATSSLAWRASYIGSRGTGLNYTVDINKPRASTTPFSTSRLPYPQFGSAYVTRTDGEWHYDAAQFDVRKRAGTVMFDSNITWSNTVSNYADTSDPYNVTSKWVRDAAARRLYFVASAGYDLPVGKGRRLLADAGTWLNRLVGNWSLYAVATAASGQYYSPLFTGPDPANASPGFVTALADCVGDPNAGARTIPQWFNPAAFSIPGPGAGRYGTCGMNSLEGYPIHVGHLSAAKQLSLGETARMIFTARVSNVFNTPHFTIPVNNLSIANAGRFVAASEVPFNYPERQGARQLDLRLRIQW